MADAPLAAAGRLARDGVEPRSVAVFRALQLGDLLCAVPALRALRRALPRACVTLIGLPWAAAFARRFSHLVDDFMAFPGHPGLPEREPDPGALPDFLRAARARRFDVAVQLHGRGDVTNGIVATLGAVSTAGFHPAGQPAPDASRYAAWPEHGHEIERLLTLIEFLGIRRAGEALEFPLTSADVAGSASVRALHGLVPGRYACVHPGARLQSRRWPAEHFAAVGRMLARDGLRVVVTGSADEAALAARVAAAVPGAIDLAGGTSLGVLGALVRDARILVCNDTGVSHVAAALRTPSVVVSCGADPARFAPLDTRLHEVLHRPVPCRPCAYDACPIGHACALQLLPSAVTERVAARIAHTAPSFDAALLRRAG